MLPPSVTVFHLHNLLCKYLLLKNCLSLFISQVDEVAGVLTALVNNKATWNDMQVGGPSPIAGFFCLFILALVFSVPSLEPGSLPQV